MAFTLPTHFLFLLKYSNFIGPRRAFLFSFLFGFFFKKGRNAVVVLHICTKSSIFLIFINYFPCNPFFSLVLYRAKDIANSKKTETRTVSSSLYSTDCYVSLWIFCCLPRWFLLHHSLEVTFKFSLQKQSLCYIGVTSRVWAFQGHYSECLFPWPPCLQFEKTAMCMLVVGLAPSISYLIQVFIPSVFTELSEPQHHTLLILF